MRIGIGAVNTDPDAAEVAATLAAYFGGIDTRNYTQAWNTYTPALQASLHTSFQGWAGKESTSQDSMVVVQSIRHDPNGDINALVSFQSHQAAQDGNVPGQTCTNWSLNYQLVPSSPGAASLPYLINNAKPVGAGPVSC